MKTMDLNTKTNRQANLKASFQRFMILMVTIMVSTTLVGCDETNSDGDKGGSGKIDPKLIEIADWWSPNPATGVWEYYSFYENGTFEYYRVYNGLMEIKALSTIAALMRMHLISHLELKWVVLTRQ